MHNLNYFIGKVCTIIPSGQLTHIITKENFCEHFTGYVEEIDESGIWLSHLITGNKSYCTLQNVVGIFEETVKKVPVKKQEDLLPIIENG